MGILKITCNLRITVEFFSFFYTDFLPEVISQLLFKNKKFYFLVNPLKNSNANICGITLPLLTYSGSLNVKF